MTTLAEYIDLQHSEWDGIERLCTDLTPEQWAVRSYCPDWDIAGVLTHVAAVEKVLTGWVPSTEQPPPFGRMGEFEVEVAGLTGPELLARCAEVMAARLVDLEAMDPSVVEAASITPTGIGTYGGFLQVRIFDLWVHRRDMAGPLGITIDDSGPTTEMALAEVGGALGYIVGKKIGLPDGMGITFHITGGVETEFHVRVDGRAARVESLEEPDVEITTDVGTFILLAAGRVDPRQRIEAGRISWSGDAEWGETAATNLRYTM